MRSKNYKSFIKDLLLKYCENTMQTSKHNNKWQGSHLKLTKKTIYNIGQGYKLYNNTHLYKNCWNKFNKYVNLIRKSFCL